MLRACLILAVSVLVASCGTTGGAGKSPSLEKQLQGLWADEKEQCLSNPETIEFSADGSEMTITRAKMGWATKSDSRKVFRYRILSRTATYLRVELERESRLDAAGRPVIWHIVPVDSQTFCWGRDDWAHSACTPPRVRCGI
jgi:hypothetical protein